MSRADPPDGLPHPCTEACETEPNVVVLVRGRVVVAVRGAQVVLGVVPGAPAHTTIVVIPFPHAGHHPSKMSARKR
jgi:predicted fused transcriptional regulator/phosphomethylpyrimidine kinase